MGTCQGCSIELLDLFIMNLPSNSLLQKIIKIQNLLIHMALEAPDKYQFRNLFHFRENLDYMNTETSNQWGTTFHFYRSLSI